MRTTAWSTRSSPKKLQKHGGTRRLLAPACLISFAQKLNVRLGLMETRRQLDYIVVCRCSKDAAKMRPFAFLLHTSKCRHCKLC